MADRAILIQSLYAGLGQDVGNGRAKFLVSSGSSTYAKVYNSEEVSDGNFIDQSATGGVPLDEQGRAIVYGYDNYFLEIYNSEGIKQNFDSNLNYRSDTFDYIDVAADYGITGEAVNQAIAVANSNSTRSYLMVFRDNEFNLLNNTIFPANTQLDIQKSAKLVLPSGTDSVTINGSIRCELYQLFKYDNNTTGTVTLNTKRHDGVYPQWFGGDPDGTTDVSFEVGRALATGVKRLILTGGAYKLNSNITIPNDVEVIRIGGADFSLASNVTVSGLGTKATVLDTLTVGTLNVTTNNSVSNSTATSITTDDLIVNDDATITDDLTVNGDSFLKAVQTNNIVPEATGTRNIGTSLLEYLALYAKNINITTLATIAGLSVTELKSNLIPDTTNTKDIGSSTNKIKDIFTEGLSVTTLKSNLIPESNNTKDIGSNLKKFKDLYLSNTIYVENLNVTNVATSLIPDTDNTKDIGSSSKKFKDAYFTGTITVGGGITALTGTFTNLSATNVTSSLVPDTDGLRDLGSSSRRFSRGFFGSTLTTMFLIVTYLKTSLVPETTNTINLGSSSKKFKDLHLSGDATIGDVLTALTANITTLTATTGTFTNLNASNVTGSLVPNTTNTKDLGSSSKKFRNGHFNGTVSATTLTGDISNQIKLGSVSTKSNQTTYLASKTLNLYIKTTVGGDDLSNTHVYASTNQSEVDNESSSCEIHKFRTTDRGGSQAYDNSLHTIIGKGEYYRVKHYLSVGGSTSVTIKAKEFSA